MRIRKKTTIQYFDEDTNQEYVFEPIENTVSVEKSTDNKGEFLLKYLTVDEHPMSPDEFDDDDTVFLVHYHRDFYIEKDRCPEIILGYIYTGNEDEYDKDGAEELLKEYHCFAVDAYIHSGVSLSLAGGFNGQLPQGHERFDVSSVGAVLVKKKEFGAGGVEFEHTREKAETIAQACIDEWNQYLRGDVYCCVVEKLDEHKESYDYDVVGGFYGFDYATECLQDEF